ncbi:MAG: thiosulfate oxidation carrier protein SoxY [Gammaproteobacteria bacterium]|nr:thiosulfate oxidation carrier protein SoxY [Gammaproteobacteria bacterium]
MNFDMKRRILLKGALASGTLGIALGAGLLTPKAAMAAWPKAAFETKDIDGSISTLTGVSGSEESDKIKIKAPDIAENGAVVPVTVSTDMAGVETIAILAEKNPLPLIASFDLGEGVLGTAGTRMKMGTSGDVIAVVKAGGKVYTARKNVKVTIGGCGG